jgi:hypothetical protein
MEHEGFIFVQTEGGTLLEHIPWEPQITCADVIAMVCSIRGFDLPVMALKRPGEKHVLRIDTSLQMGEVVQLVNIKDNAKERNNMNQKTPPRVMLTIPSMGVCEFVDIHKDMDALCFFKKCCKDYHLEEREYDITGEFCDGGFVMISPKKRPNEYIFVRSIFDDRFHGILCQGRSMFHHHVLHEVCRKEQVDDGLYKLVFDSDHSKAAPGTIIKEHVLAVIPKK